MKLRFLFTIFCAFILCQSFSQVRVKKSISTNGNVSAFTQKGDTLFMGGSFTKIGTGVKQLAKLINGSDSVDINFPEISGSNSITAVTSDGNNGFYLAGSFDNFDDAQIPQTSLLHIFYDGKLDVSFKTVSANATIDGVKKFGNRLYIVGSFSEIQGINRPYLAALNASTGDLLNWQPETPNEFVQKVDANDSIVVIQSYYMTSVGSTAIRDGYAVFSASTGNLIKSFPGFDKSVNSICIDSNTLYVGGSFSNAGAYKIGIAEINTEDYNFDNGFPTTNGYLECITSDGQGGYFIGGYFSQVGDQTRNNLAHILSNGTVDEQFNIPVENTVYSLAVQNRVLYVGGDFFNFGDSVRQNIASINLNTNKVTGFNPVANSTVFTIACKADTVYFGGSFTNVKGVARKYAAAVTTSNVLTSWAPVPNNKVNKIMIGSNNRTLFLAGDFTTVHGSAIPYLSKVDAVNGIPYSWKPSPDGGVHNFKLYGNLLYLTGAFSKINGVQRSFFAALDTGAVKPTTLIANANGEPKDVLLSGDKLYLSGSFTSIQNQSRRYIARLDVNSGLIDNWNSDNSVSPNSFVNAMAISTNSLVIGGYFTFFSSAVRNHLAAIDLAQTKYNLKPWSPNVSHFNAYAIDYLLHSGSEIFGAGTFTYSYDSAGLNVMKNLIALNDKTGNVTRKFKAYPSGSLSTLNIYNSKLFVLGNFQSFFNFIGQNGSVDRIGIAAYNLETNGLDSLDYRLNGSVAGIVKDKADNLILCGGFTLINCEYRNMFAAINVRTDTAFALNLNISGSINALALKDSTLFIGGAYQSLKGNLHSNLAALNLKTGAFYDWSPNPNSTVIALSIKDSILYAGGSFTTVKNQQRAYGASFNWNNSGSLTNWNPKSDGIIYAIQPVDNRVYIGGSFYNINNSYRRNLAEVNTTDGIPSNWNPSPDNYVRCFYLTGRSLFVGGAFYEIAGQLKKNLAKFNTTSNSLDNFTTPVITYDDQQTTSIITDGKQMLFGGYRPYFFNNKNLGNVIATDTITGVPTNSQSFINNTAGALSISSNKLFVGGNWYPSGEAYLPDYLTIFILEPKKPASSLKFQNIKPTSLTASWKNGDGNKRLVVMREIFSPVAPADSKTYLATNKFKKGDSTGVGSFVVFNGITNKVNISNLLPNHSYTVSVYECNSDGSNNNYLQSPYLTDTVSTPCQLFSFKIDSSGPLTMCPKDSVTLIGPPGYNYFWSDGTNDRTLTAWQEGRYGLTVRDSNGCIAYNTVHINVKPCLTPINLGSSNITSSSAKVNWLGDSCSTGYRIQLRIKGTTAWQTNSLPATSSSFTYSGLNSNTIYQWRIAAICQKVPLTISDYSTIQTFKTSTNLFADFVPNNLNVDSINRVSLQLSVTPNPVTESSIVTINSAEGPVQLNLTTLAGQILWQKTCSSSMSTRLPVSELTFGTYILTAKDLNQTRVIKIIKVK